MTMDLSPIIISLKTATLSIIITFFLGVAAAQFVFRLKNKTMSLDVPKDAKAAAKDEKSAKDDKKATKKPAAKPAAKEVPAEAAPVEEIVREPVEDPADETTIDPAELYE